MFKPRANRDRHGGRTGAAAPIWPTPAGERRWQPRVAASIAAQFRERWHRRFGVEIVELSTHGCRLECARPPAPGGHSWIMLPAIESRYARVVWSDGRHCGLEFDQPFHPAVIAMLLCRALLSAPSRAA